MKTLVCWLIVLLLVGCGQAAKKSETMYLKRQLTEAEVAEITRSSEAALKELREKYDPRGITNTLDLLQQWFDDGSFAKTEDLTDFGHLWGDVLAKKMGGQWVVAQFEGTEYHGLNIPMTTITLAPISMLEKRQQRDEQINFNTFLMSTIQSVGAMQADPKYQAPDLK